MHLPLWWPIAFHPRAFCKMLLPLHISCLTIPLSLQPPPRLGANISSLSHSAHFSPCGSDMCRIGATFPTEAPNGHGGASWSDPGGLQLKTRVVLNLIPVNNGNWELDRDEVCTSVKAFTSSSIRNDKVDSETAAHTEDERQQRAWLYARCAWFVSCTEGRDQVHLFCSDIKLFASD